MARTATAKRLIAPELLDTSYRYGVAPHVHRVCARCRAVPTPTKHKGLPALWLFQSREAAARFRATGLCQPCQGAQDRDLALRVWRWIKEKLKNKK